MHYRAGSEPRPCAACCAGDETDRQTGRGETEAAEDGAESLPRDDRRFLAVMESGEVERAAKDNTRRLRRRAALGRSRAKPPGVRANTAWGGGGCTATQRGAHHAVDQPRWYNHEESSGTSA
eukprot:scaffold1238_cov116-Isochrysis_galbana.AAC.5